MVDLLSLPIELIRKVLDHLRPFTSVPYSSTKLDDDEWGIRYWSRNLAALARTCQVLHTLAVPLLYSVYEAHQQIPIHTFIDRISSEESLRKGLRCVITRHDGPKCQYEPTTARRALYGQWAVASDSQLKQYGLRNDQELTSDVCAELEVWRVVSQAPNLEVLSVTSFRSDALAYDLPPVWLLPVALAATRLHVGLGTNGWFDRLHTLEVSMKNKCGLYLALFFQLPSLERISISRVQWIPVKDAIPWPEPKGTSKVHTLDLDVMGVRSSLIVRMIGYCKELRSFRCHRCPKADIVQGELESTEVWCTNIMNSLQRHSRTLKELDFDPADMHRQEPSSDLGFTHLETIRTLEALEFLKVPSMLLLGQPPGDLIYTDWQTTIPWRYPLLRDVLPPSLTTLRLYMDDRYTHSNLGLGESLLSSLSAKEDTGLGRLRVDNVFMSYNEPLPMDFWQVQDEFRKSGSSFLYRVRLDIDYSFPCDFYLDSMFDVVAGTLSSYGPKGVQMALNFENLELPRKVMNILNLGKEWLQTREAEEVMFGQSCDYDAVGTRWAVGFEVHRR